MKKFTIKQPTKQLTKEQWIGNKDKPVIRMTVEIEEDQYQEFKMRALKDKKTISELVRKFIGDYVAN